MSEAGQDGGTVTRPSRESLAHMASLRDSLDELRKTIPEVRGFAYWGSRPRGRESKVPGDPSDLDTVAFFDGSEYDSVPTVDMNGMNIPGSEAINERNQRKKEELKASLKSKVSKLMEQRGLPVDINYGYNLTVFVEDISPASTDQAIRNFVNFVDDKEAHPDVVSNISIFPLISRFLFGVGDGLYQNRVYILDRFEAMERNGEHGEKYFRSLMDRVRKVQMSGVQTSAKTPQTITEGRAAFRLK